MTVVRQMKCSSTGHSLMPISSEVSSLLDIATNVASGVQCSLFVYVFSVSLRLHLHWCLKSNLEWLLCDK